MTQDLGSCLLGSTTTDESIGDSTGDTLTEDCVEILVVLSDASEAVPAARLAARFNMHPEKMKFYLDDLKDKKLIGNRLIVGQSPTYFLAKEGRRYLVLIDRL